MKKSLVRAFTLFLAALMMLSVLVACSEQGQGDNTGEVTTAAVADNNTEPQGDPNKDAAGFLKDQLPEDLNYNGQTVKVLVWDDVEHEEFEAEQDGDVVLSAIYQRNMNVTKRLNVEIEYIRIPGNSDHNNDWNTYVGNSVKLTERDFDILGGYSLSIAKNATSGYLYNMLDAECEYLNFDNPWWSQLLVDQATCHNNLYFASGDISRNALEMMYVCFVNTNLLTDHNLQNPQELVDSGDWTYEKFIQMCEGIYEDDGNGKKDTTADSGDTFGYMCSGIHNDPWFYGSGATICDKDAEGNLIVSESLNSERVINTVAMFQTLFYNSNDGIYTSSVWHQKAFGQGRLLFMTDRCRVSHKVLANTYAFSDFVIVPCPKYDKDQQNYITVMGNPFTLFAIAADNKDPSLASAFIECFASEGYRNVTPAVFEFSLKSRYSFDSTSSRMYDFIRANVTYDLGRIFSSSLVGQSDFRNALSTQGTVWNAKGIITKLNKTLESLNDALAGNFE